MKRISSIMPCFSVPPSVRVWAEVDLDAIRRNLTQVQAAAGRQSSVIAVVKADAYGHGAVAVAGAIAGGVEMFGVANVEEGEEIRAAGSGREILVLSPCLPSERAAAVAAGFVVTVSSAAEARAYAALGQVRLNFKIDTGMGRAGVWWESAAEELSQIAGLPSCEVHSISSHLPSSDEEEAFTRRQLALFRQLIENFRPILPRVRVHVMNSAGALRFRSQPGDLVRAGLALYGVSPLEELQGRFEPALTLKARVVLVRDLPVGASVSYGRTFITERATKTAILPVGYADGLPRSLSGRGASVLINGRRCPLLGRVTMDQVVVDVTDAGEVAESDEAVLIGQQGGEKITVAELAAQAGTIPWEILTGLQRRVVRFYPPTAPEVS